MCVVVAVVVELFMLLFLFVSFLAKCVDPYKTILTQQSPTVPPSSSHNLFASQYLDLINSRHCVYTSEAGIITFVFSITFGLESNSNIKSCLKSFYSILLTIKNPKKFNLIVFCIYLIIYQVIYFTFYHPPPPGICG